MWYFGFILQLKEIEMSSSFCFCTVYGLENTNTDKQSDKNNEKYQFMDKISAPLEHHTTNQVQGLELTAVLFEWQFNNKE